MTEQFKNLFSPFQLKHLTLSNRVIMPAMQRGWCKDGAPLRQLADYYRKRVEGGVSLVIGESAAVDHPSATAQRTSARLDERSAPAWLRCVEEVAAAGGKMLLQLWHEGGLRSDDDGQTLSPSGIAYPGLTRGRAATSDDLLELRCAYTRSARIAQSIGATGIELHCAHGYLLDQFLWPMTNRRGDAYGVGGIADRARLHAEIISDIRGACGADFIISVRFSQWKEHDFNARIVETVEELRTMTQMFKSAGADLLHASTRRYWLPEWSGDDRPFAALVRSVSGMPTIAVGSVGLDKDVMESFGTPGETRSRVAESVEQLDAFIGLGYFDLVAVGRSLISDAAWANKVRARRFSTIKTFKRKDIDYLEWDGLPAGTSEPS